jgi:hypothetical protein
MPLVDNVDNWRRFRSAEFEFRHGQGFVPAIPDSRGNTAE